MDVLQQKSPPAPPLKRAFSLVELSIVLVVLGLLVGGVLAGKSLIRASQLRKITTEHAEIFRSFVAFRDKYFYLPGDMPNATQFWGTDVSCSPPSLSSGTPTCNGNGDGFIYNTGGNQEGGLAWKHMRNSGIMVTTSPHGHRPSLGSWGPNAQSGTGIYSAATFAFDGEYGNEFRFNFVNIKILTPEEVWNIDTKVDDGKPARGKVVVMVGGLAAFPICTDASGGTPYTMLDASYNLADTSKFCSLIFRNQF